MAFESKYKSQGEMCPICRRQFTDGRKIDNPAYGETGQAMCKDCFNRLYKNRKKNRTAAITDDSANLTQKNRPSQILERPRFRQGTEPAGGYEFVMPQLTHHGMILSAAMWVVLVVAVRFIINLLMPPEESPLNFSFSHDGTMLLFAGVSLVWAVAAVKNLIKGIALGMGHSRRIILLVTALVMLALTWFDLPEFITDIIPNLLHLLHK